MEASLVSASSLSLVFLAVFTCPIFKPLSALPLEPKMMLITPPPDLGCCHGFPTTYLILVPLVLGFSILELLWTSYEDVHRHMHPSSQDTQRHSPMPIATAKWSWAYALLAHFWFQGNIIECTCLQRCAWMQERPTDRPTHSLTDWLTDCT